MDVVICVRRVSRCIEGKHTGELGGEVARIQDSRRIFGRHKKGIWKGDEEGVKVAELKRLEQEGKIMEEFVQKFRRVARRSDYNKRPLVEEFKRRINSTVC